MAAIAAVAGAAALVLAGLWGAQRSAAGRARAAAREQAGRLRETVEQLERSEEQRRAADVRAGAAEGRARAADQRASDAEKRAGEAERRVGEALRRAGEAERRAAEADEVRAVWDLERVRMEREWLDVVGPGVPLPVPWDGSLGAVLATELAIIREVIGTPSDLDMDKGPRSLPPPLAAAAARLSVEMLRALARSGEEMTVRMGGGGISVVQRVGAGEQPPDLSELSEVARRAGFLLSVDLDPAGATTRLEIAG